MGKLSSRDRKLAHIAGQNVSNIENGQFATLSASASQTILQGPLQVVPTTGFLTIATTMYWSYIGYTQKTLVADYVQFIQTVVAAGTTQIAEIYLATSTSAPDGSSKVLTVKYANGTLDDLKATTAAEGVVRGNTTAAAFTISPATHLWAGARFAMTTGPTQPTLLGVGLDLSVGNILVTTSVSPAVAGDTKTGTLLAQGIAATAIAPLLRVKVKA